MDIEKLAREADLAYRIQGIDGLRCNWKEDVNIEPYLRAFTALVMQECARICEEVRDSAPNHVDWDAWLDAANKCADMIRAQVPNEGG